MRILFVAPLNSIHSKRWIDFMSGQTCTEVHAATISDMTFEPTAAEIHVLPLPPRKESRLSYLARTYAPFRRRVRELVRHIRPDVIHVHWLDLAHSEFSGWHQIPLVVTPWGSDILIHPRKSWSAWYGVRKLLRNATAVTCDAPHLKQKLRAYGVSNEDIHIIHFGTDVDTWHMKNRDAGLAEELGFEKDCSLILSLRSLYPVYDVATLLKAGPRIIDEYGKARFVIGSDGDERKSLEELAAKLGLEDKVRFTGRLSDRDMRRFAASAKVYVSTSTSDAGLSASTAEAMASGTPVVITDFGDNRTWVEEGRSGRLFPIGDAEALAREVCMLLTNQERATEIGRRGRAIIVERNNYAKEMKKAWHLCSRLAEADTTETPQGNCANGTR